MCFICEGRASPKPIFLGRSTCNTSLFCMKSGFYSLDEVLDFRQFQACLSFHFLWGELSQILVNGFIVLALAIRLLNFLPLGV